MSLQGETDISSAGFMEPLQFSLKYLRFRLLRFKHSKEIFDRMESFLFLLFFFYIQKYGSTECKNFHNIFHQTI